MHTEGLSTAALRRRKRISWGVPGGPGKRLQSACRSGRSTGANTGMTRAHRESPPLAVVVPRITMFSVEWTMNNSKQFNVAIIGLGFGAEFIPIYQKHPGANMYAVCQRNPERLRQVADAFGVEKRYTNYADVLADPQVDFVHINSPIPDHAPMSIAALKAGKHVFCTVPMATTIDECRQIVELVKQTGLTYMMAETVVYSREFLFLKDLYQKGELGKIQYLAASHPQDMDGWPEYWERMIPMHYATHVVSPCLGSAGSTRGLCVVLRIRHGP